MSLHPEILELARQAGLADEFSEALIKRCADIARHCFCDDGFFTSHEILNHFNLSSTCVTTTIVGSNDK